MSLIQQGIDDAVKQVLCALVADMQDSCAADPVMNRKADPHQRSRNFSGHGISLAASDQKVRLQFIGFFRNFNKIDIVKDVNFLSTDSTDNLGDFSLEMPAFPAGCAQHRNHADFT